ncbi:MAG: PAS domain-containing protein, partial [Geminicoccaceae bacterium]|nr:PAS domain-containing protein [Geminicoccaceae bacterium]
MSTPVGQDEAPAPDVDPGPRCACGSNDVAELRWLARSPQPALICRLDRRILWANSAFGDSVQRPAAELEGLDYLELVPAKDRAAVEDSFRRVARGEVLNDLLGRIQRPGGEIGWIEWAVVPDLDAGTCLAIGRSVTSERLRLGEARALRRHLQDALERIVEGFALFDRDDRLVHCNQKFRDLYPSLRAGSERSPTFAELTRELAYSGIMPAAVGREEQWIEERVRRHRSPNGIHHFKVADGRWIQVDEQHTSSGGTVLVRSDVTALKQREQAYALFAAAVDQAGDSIELSDAEARLIYVNPAFTALTGYTPTEALGRSTAELLQCRPEDPEAAPELAACLSAGRGWSGRLVSRTKSGALIHQDTTISPLRDETGQVTNFVTVKRDVSAQIASEMQIRHLAHHDALTDLPNRILFRDRLRQALAETRRSGGQRALLLLDLDHFKDINDT